jgi:hypothetical protein
MHYETVPVKVAPPPIWGPPDLVYGPRK